MNYLGSLVMINYLLEKWTIKAEQHSFLIISQVKLLFYFYKLKFLCSHTGNKAEKSIKM